MPTPLQIYHERLNRGEVRPDAAQEAAAQALDHLHHQILNAKAPKKILGIFPRKKSADDYIKGIYIHGGVGRGKSMLVDLFYSALPDSVPKRRVHFHEFMIETHDYFHQRRQDDAFEDGIDGALPAYACRIAERVKVLCFDEFHVTDVADAMILGRLFTALFDHGVIVVATSNWVPEKLYEGGLQRDRFLPFIALLKTRMHVIHLDSGLDYRTQFESAGGTYFYPLNEETRRKADDLFTQMSKGARIEPRVVHVKGRDIVAQQADGIARFPFKQLCAEAHGAEDYIHIAQSFHTMFLEEVPKLTPEKRNEAKRLMTLIDALYENQTRLIVTAEVPPEGIYAGHDHAFEFDRTISRLQEMQSPEYLNKRA